MVGLSQLSPRAAVLVGVLAVGLFFSDNPVFTVIASLILYGLWYALVALLVPRTRYVGGIALIVLSIPVFGIAFIANWVGIYAVFLLAHGNWLSLSSAARLHR